MFFIPINLNAVSTSILISSKKVFSLTYLSLNEFLIGSISFAYFSSTFPDLKPYPYLENIM